VKAKRPPRAECEIVLDTRNSAFNTKGPKADVRAVTCHNCGKRAWWCGPATELVTGHLILIKTCTGCGFYKIMPCEACDYITNQKRLTENNRARVNARHGAKRLGN
jgi:uncharacterized Fe-S cluster-containing MiaB family protein